jgi:hypothetical protein
MVKAEFYNRDQKVNQSSHTMSYHRISCHYIIQKLQDAVRIVLIGIIEFCKDIIGTTDH